LIFLDFGRERGKERGGESMSGGEKGEGVWGKKKKGCVLRTRNESESEKKKEKKKKEKK
jgi:hypothetical protein